MCPLTVALITICSILTLLNAYLVVKLKQMKQDLKDQQDVNRLLNIELEKEGATIK